MTDETRDADDVGADVEITPEMIEAGVGELLTFYSDEIFDCAECVVKKVYRAMATAESVSQHANALSFE